MKTTEQQLVDALHDLLAFGRDREGDRLSKRAEVAWSDASALLRDIGAGKMPRQAAVFWSTLKAVHHELKYGEACEGDRDAIAVCVRLIEDSLPS